MSAVSRSPAKEQQYKFGKYSSKASMKSEAYSLMVSSSRSSVGVLRVAACRAHLTSPSHSLKFPFSTEEEKALVVVCRLYARQGIPLSIIVFIKLASHFAKKKRVSFFLVILMLFFFERHNEVLCKARGKLTIPTRCNEVMKEKTYKFFGQ